tara:strand:- start:2857 stop:3261 length:405 start_codon:yes stop_codon:yes gene_type:complete
MKLNELEIYEDDFDLFVALDAPDKIEFLFDATQVGLEQATVKQVSKLADKYGPSEPIVTVQDFRIGISRLCVTQFPDKLYLNSDSLKAIRYFVKKLWNDGLLLETLKDKKTDFDMYRFFKAYKIIGRVDPYSSN